MSIFYHPIITGDIKGIRIKKTKCNISDAQYVIRELIWHISK